MSYKSVQKEFYLEGQAPELSRPTITIGTVVDTNDPQQMGRVRAVCPTMGDNFSSPIIDIPWAIYGAPFAGQTEVGTRGPGIRTSEGGIAYGMWAIPKVGSQVLIMCIDGDPEHRVYLGCIYPQYSPHTMPHGRYMYDDHPDLQKSGNDSHPFGPYTTLEKFIEPLHTNQRLAFSNQSDENYEWRTRAADYTVAGLDVSQLSLTGSNVQDDKDAQYDDWVSTQGYQTSRIDPFAPVEFTDRNYDSMVYSITSPGFHAFSMDDRQENCRIRLRTTSGHQIIMDDTNERIYISTSKGNNWIELDSEGNIDIHAEGKVSIHSKKDINMTSDETIRMYGTKGIHMYSGDEIRMEANKDVHMKFFQNLRLHVGQSSFTQVDQNMHLRVGQNTYQETFQEHNVYAHTELRLTSGTSTSINAGNEIRETAAAIHLNGPSASIAGQSEQPNEQSTFWTSRVPQHEPWARTATKDDFSHTPEFNYNSPNVNRVERGQIYNRGRYWRR